MPKFEYNHRTGQMEMKKPTGIEFHKVVGGLKVVDFDLPASFIILRDNDNIGYANGRAATSVKIFDIRKARMIADRVKRVLPNSKYTDYTYFCKSVKTTVMTEEDTNLLEALMESYGEAAINESVNSITENILNEGYGPSVLNPKWSDNQTRGAQDVGPNKKRLRGISGFVKTLPSMAISFAICPPLALIQLIGAVRHRQEKKWLGRLFNSKTWLDFIATPSEKQEELKQKMKDAFAKKTQFYYVTLDNNEILKVPAVNTLEAKDMVLAISRKDIIPRYENWNSSKSGIKHQDANSTGLVDGIADSNDSNNIADTLKYTEEESCKMWAVKFNDGQCCYAFGHEGQRDEIKKKAEESKKAIIDYYKKIKLKGGENEDNKKNKTLKHDGIGTNPEDGTEYLDEMFTYPVVDDMIEIKNTGMYKMITEANVKDFSTPSTSAPGPWQPLDYAIFRIPIGECQTDPNLYAITLNILAPNPTIAGRIANRILEDDVFRNFLRRQRRTVDVDDATIDSRFGINQDESPLEKRTEQFTICGSSFTITYIDNRRYRRNNNDLIPDGNRIVETTRNNTDYIFFSELNTTGGIVDELTRVIDNAYSAEFVEKSVKAGYVDRLRRSMNTTTIQNAGTHTYTANNVAIQRNTVHTCDWANVDAISNAGNSVNVDNCVKQRPNGEVLAQGVTVPIAA